MSRSVSPRLSARRPRRLGPTLIVAVMAAFTVLGLTSTASAETPQKSVVYQMKFRHSGKCLNNGYASTEDGHQVEQYTCFEWAITERWRLDYVKTDAAGRPLYLIRNMQSNKCLNIWYDSRVDGGKVVQYECGWDKPEKQWNNELFTIEPVRDPYYADYYQVRSLSSSRCLNVEGASEANEAHVIQYYCDNRWFQGTENMMVRFVPVFGSLSQP
jgi:pectinesterase